MKRHHSSFSYATKREHMRYFETQTANNVAENFDYYFRIYKAFITSSALQTSVPPNLYLLLRLSWIRNIFNVSFFSRLNRLNALSPYQTFVPAMQRIHSITDESSSFESRSKFNTWHLKHVTLTFKIHFPHFLVFFVFFYLHQKIKKTKEFLAFMKETINAFVISITSALFSIDWLTNF